MTLFGETLRRLGVDEHTVDDAIQEVFLVVHRRIKEFEFRSSLRTWLFSILINVARNFVRKRIKNQQRSRSLESEEQLSMLPHPKQDKRVEHWMAWRELDQLMLRIPIEQRAILVLSELEGFSGPELAEQLGLPLNTVYSRLRLAKNRLEALVNKRDEKERTHE